MSLLIPIFIADLAALLSLTQHHIPGARLVEESGREAVLNLPQAAAKDSSLAVFLTDLDQRLPELGISSYGLSDSTLEEVKHSHCFRSIDEWVILKPLEWEPERSFTHCFIKKPNVQKEKL